MAEVTQAMILDYMVKKGGVVKNVDLVRHFKKYLQIESAAEKERARVVFKERVNAVAVIKADSKHEKTLHLRPEFCPPGLVRPPTGRPLTAGSDHSSLSSQDDIGSRHYPLENRFSLASVTSELSGIRSPDPIANSHSPTFTPVPPPATPTSAITRTTPPPPAATKTTPSPLKTTPPPAAKPTPPPTQTTPISTTPTMKSTKLKGLGEDDFGASLMAELDSFGSLLDTFGSSGGSSSVSKAPSTSYSSASATNGTAVSTSSSLTSGPAPSAARPPSSPSRYNSYATSSSLSTSQTPSGPAPSGASSRYSSYSSSTASTGPALSSAPPPASSRYSNYSSPAHSSTPPPASSRYSNYSSPAHSSTQPPSSAAPPPTSSRYSNYSASSPSPAHSSAPPPSSAAPPPSSAAPPTTSSRYSNYSTSSSGSGNDHTPSPAPPPVSSYSSLSATNSTPLTSSPLTKPPVSPQRGLSPQRVSNSTPSPKYSGTSNGMPKNKPGGGGRGQDLGLDLTDMLSSLPSANTSNGMPKSKPGGGGGRGQDLDLDLTDMLSSLPSANPSSFGGKGKSTAQKGKSPPAFGGGRTEEPAKPVQQPSYQNSTRFDQPKPAYQNSTRFDQPKAAQSSYQNSTRFEQPSAQPVQNRYQNTTRFDQPTQPQAPPTQPQAPPTQNIYDQLTSHSHGNSNGPVQSHSHSTGIASGLLESHSRSPQPAQRNPEPFVLPKQGTKQAPPPAPTRTSSISQDSLPRSRKTGPPPPSVKQGHTSPIISSPLGESSQGSTNSPSSLGGLDLGDLSSSLFSSAAGSAPSHTLSTSPGDLTRTDDLSAAAPPYSRKLGPAVSIPPAGGQSARSQVERRQNSGDFTPRRQGSIDSTPSIRIDSPTGISTGSGSPSHRRARSPPTDSLDLRMRALSSGNIPGGVNTSTLANLGVQLRNKEGKRRDNPARRSSKNLEKTANLDNYTRLSIQMTPPTSRKHRPPDVAPKPLRSSSSASSREDVRNQQPADGAADEDAHSEYDYDEIDPLEKEWMLAGAQADMDALQRLLMTEPTLLNHRGFLHGYTALHWAAKHGRMDILGMLLMQGAHTDVRTMGGLTPLHLAAQAGHDSVIELLVTQHNANISIRENGGRRAIDMLHSKCSQASKTLLSHLHNHGLPIRVENQPVPTFSVPHEVRSSLDRNWRSMGELIHNATEKHLGSKKKMSPRTNIRKTFSFSRKGLKINRESVVGSPKKSHKRGRPVSEAVMPTSYNKYDV